MFGLDASMLVFVALAGLSAGLVAYAFLFKRMETESNTERRLSTVRQTETDRSLVKASRDRTAEVAKRKKSVQDTLKELDDKQRAKDRNIKKPPLKVQIR